jgi:DNA end-binding protein Ku
MDGALGLETLYFGDEIRTVPSRVREAGEVPVATRELEIAKQLIEMLASPWEPSMFSDEYREELLRLIAERTPERIDEAETAPTAAGSRIEDLMDALRKSVEEAKASKGARSRRTG